MILLAALILFLIALSLSVTRPVLLLALREHRAGPVNARRWIKVKNRPKEPDPLGSPSLLKEESEPDSGAFEIPSRNDGVSDEDALRLEAQARSVVSTAWIASISFGPLALGMGLILLGNLIQMVTIGGDVMNNEKLFILFLLLSLIGGPAILISSLGHWALRQASRRRLLS